MSTIRFETRSGSLYEIDPAAMTWRRLRHAEASNELRTSDGRFTWISEIRVGHPVEIHGEPLTQPADVRIISTTPVTRITKS